MAVRGGRAAAAVACALIAGQIVAVVWPSSARAAPAFVVNDVGDAPDLAPGNGECATAEGICTLRAALQEADATPGQQVVGFEVPGPGPHTIQLASELPTLINPAGTVVDGYTQPGAAPNTDADAFDASIQVEVRGTGPTGIDGFVLNGPNNVIRGLAIYDFERGIRLFGVDANNNDIVGNLLGTDATGTFGAPEYVAGSMAVNLQAGANNNRIGLPGVENRNVVSGNAQHGIALYDNGTTDNSIQNNLIGLAPSGDAPLTNWGHGVDINTWASNTLVGGAAPGERNVVAAVGLSGVEISHGIGTRGNRVIGNSIGTDATGATAPEWAAIGQFGVNLEGLAICDDVCEPDMSQSFVADNVIVNALGGVMLHKATFDNVVTGNSIGVLPDGTAAGHAVFGVRVEKGAYDNVIGPDNVIANNANGIQLIPVGSNPPSLTPVETPRNTFTRNAVFDNGGLGIDLQPLGSLTVSPDALVNSASAAPTITNTSSATATVAGCDGCIIELFIADAPAGSYGSGSSFLADAILDATGTIDIRLPSQAIGTSVTATSTLPDGSTSEFSRNVAVPVPSPTNTDPSAAFDVSCPVSACTFDAATSSDADGAIEWYQWDFGNGDTLLTQTATTTFEYGVVGTFDVTLTVVDNDGAAANSTQQAQPTNVDPSAAFDVACDLQLCRFTSTGSDPDGEIVGHTWDFAGLASSTDQDPVFAFPASGTFVVTHTVSDNSAGTASVTESISVDAFPNGLIGLDGFSRVVSTGLGDAPIGGAWTITSGTPDDFAVDGTTGMITIDQSAALRRAELVGVSQRDVTIRATSRTDVAPEGWGLTSHFTARSDATATEYRARLRRSSSGSSYLAVVKTVGSFGQQVIGNEVLIPGVPSGPGVDVTIAFDVRGTDPTALRAKAWIAGSAEPTDWLIDVTDDTLQLQTAGAVGFGAAPASSHTNVPVEFGFDDFVVVTDNDPPTPAVTFDCVNQTCNFDASGSSDPDGTITFWSWDFGAGNVQAGPSLDSVTFDFAEFGPNDVTLTITDNVGGTASITETVVVTNEPPQPSFTVDCVELACSFDATNSIDPDGTIVDYAWDFGAGATASGPDLTTTANTYLVTDTYTVALTVTDDDGDIEAATITITPSLAPVADISTSCDLLVCELDASGSSDADGDIVTFEWDLGPAGLASGPIVTTAFPDGTPVDVSVTITDNSGLSDTATAVADPNASPLAIIDSLCDQNDCTFDASNSIDTDGAITLYEWDFGDGTTATGAAAAHTFATSGEQTVTLTVTDDEGAVTSEVDSVVLSATPIVTFDVSCDLLECSFDGAASFDPDGTALTFAWNFGDGATATGATATHTYTTGAALTVRLDATDEQGSIGRAEVAIDPNAPPEPSFDAACVGLACTFDASASIDDGSIVDYSWDFGDGTTATGPVADIVYANKADYDVTLTVTDDEAVDASTTAVVTPNTAPTAAFVAACPSTTCSFDASTSTDPDGTITTYSWDFGDGATATGPTPSHTFADVAGATVSLTVVDDNGATATTTQAVMGNVLPVAAFDVTCALTTCNVDGALSSDADGSIVSYEWNWNDGTTSNGVIATHTYGGQLPAAVELTVTDNSGGTASTTEMISLSRTLAVDAFERSEQNSWGRADIGGTWAVFGGAGSGAAFSVDGTTGAIEVPNAGTGRSARLLAAFARNTDLEARFATDKPATGWGQYFSLIGRRAGVNLEYRARVRVAPDGTIRLSAVKLTGSSSELPIGSEVAVPGITHIPDAWYRVRARFDGADPTTIKIRLWPDGTPEPGVWHVDVTDSQIELQSGGPVGVNVALSASATNAPVTFSVDDFSAMLSSAEPAGVLSANCSDLTCDFDASGISDADGEIVSIEWDFGDGGTATGVTATHTFGAGGPTTVTATVTDDDGSVAVIEVVATPIDPNPPSEVVTDTFERVVANAFGTAEIGGDWQTGGGASASSYAVADGNASIVVSSPASGRSARLLDVNADDVDATTSFRVDKAPTGWGQYVSLIVRRTESATGYRARVRINASGLYVGAVKTVGSSSEQLIGPEVRADGVSVAPDTWYRIRVTAQGADPTTLRIKVWAADQAEPGDWLITVTDTEPALRGPGGVGLNVALSGSATNAPVRFEIDDFIVTRL